MANTLTAVMPKLLANGLLALRETCVMPRLVSRSYEAMAGQKGSTIDVPIPSAIAAQDVSPAATPPSTADVAPTSVAIALDKWKEAPFYMTDKDMLEAMEGVVPMQASEAVKAIANAIDVSIHQTYKDVYGYAGVAGTTPFGSSTIDATDLRKILNKQLCPVSDRQCVFDPDAEANALNLRAFQDASWSGSPAAIIEGRLNQKLGFAWWMSQNVQTHTAGTITTGLIAKAATAQAVGDQTIVCTTAASTGACALKQGDIVTFAGHSQTYTLTADATQASASTDVTLNISPGLKTALAGSEAVSVKSSHVVNYAFHPTAIAFATRPLEGAANGLGSLIQTAVDPESGLTLRLEVSREHKRTRWSFDALWGCKVIRPELAARLAG